MLHFKSNPGIVSLRVTIERGSLGQGWVNREGRNGEAGIGGWGRLRCDCWGGKAGQKLRTWCSGLSLLEPIVMEMGGRQGRVQLEKAEVKAQDPRGANCL